MAPGHSPRKQLSNLATGDERSTARKPLPQRPLTRRAFFCGVVVEGSEHGRELPPDVQDLVASLGDPMDLEPEPSTSQLPTNNSSYADLSQSSNVPHTRKRATTITSGSSTVSPTGEVPLPSAPFSRKRASTINAGLSDVINELVSTERSYVKRLRTLKADYADPLRTFSRSKETAIIPPYEAKTLFGNIDQLLPVNEAFLADLEMMLSPDGHEVGGIGDVALKHFKERRGFENYKQYYAKREEAQAIFEREVRKTSGSGFSAFIDRIKYAAASDNRNRVGLRELLMEPVQRIPRYTLLFRQMIKQMPIHDPQRAKLLEADGLASKIASAEVDEQTKRAGIMYCLKSTIEDFPPALVSNSRRYVDCIDVEDVILPSQDSGPGTPGGSGSGSVLHCSLLLFDDKLVIVKRPGNGERSARALSGLDDLDKVTKLQVRHIGKVKTGMVCKGVVEITDVTISDVGGADFHLYMDSPPTDQTDRWAGRPFRALSAVLPSSSTVDSGRLFMEKQRFLDNLWDVQARYRTKNNQSVALCAEEIEVDKTSHGKVTLARTYFNVYQRTAFLQEPKKTKVVMHIDPLGSADPIEFGMRGPFVVVRVHPMPGNVVRYIASSCHAGGESMEDIVPFTHIPDALIKLIHRFSVFTFKTGNSSVPSTPGGTTRTRTGIFGLDISRNLFHNRTASSRTDIFGGSINNHKRSKTTVASRSSAYATSTSTGDSSLTHFTRSRSNSITTAATSVDDDGRSVALSLESGSRSSRRSVSKLSKSHRGKSPESMVESGSEAEASPVRSASRASSDWYTDNEDFDDEPTFIAPDAMDDSERDLVARLALARKNSQTQPENLYTSVVSRPGEETIYEYEDEPPPSLRPASQASRAAGDVRDPSNHEADDDLGEDVLSLSRPESRAGDRRPLGPRGHSPLPPSKTPSVAALNLPSTEDLSVADAFANLSISTPKPPGKSSGTSALPRSRRQPFDVPTNPFETPRRVSGSSSLGRTPSVEPLSIKRKPSIGYGTSPLKRRAQNLTRASPHAKHTPRKASSGSLRRTSSQLRSLRSRFTEESDKLFEECHAVKVNLESAQQISKRLRSTSEQVRAAAGSSGEQERSTSPIKALRSAARPVSSPQTAEARARFEEMQRLIGKRAAAADSTPRRPLSFIQEESPSRSPLPAAGGDDALIRNMNELAIQLDNNLDKAVSSFELIDAAMRAAVSHSFEMSKELVHARSDALCQKRQHECVRQLMDGTMAEMAVLYDSFNEELERVFDEVQLPEDDAWDAIAQDLRDTKMIKQSLENANKELQIRLAEEQNRSETYLELLRKHGIVVHPDLS